MTESTSQAAARLGTTIPTVDKLIRKGKLSARREPRGQLGRFRWRIDSSSVDKYLAVHGRYDQATTSHRVRLATVAARVDELEEQIGEIRGRAPDGKPQGSDLADARARIVTLEDALARSQAAADLHQDIDKAHAELVGHLIKALNASTAVDGLRGQVEDQLREALSTLLTPGHVWSLTSITQQELRPPLH
jgi:excisionase family DNA binding protein